MSVYRKKKDKENPYMQLHKAFVYDKTLSFKAKGILLYLLSRPDDWKVYEKEIIKHAKDGRESVRNGLKELEQQGYIQRTELRDGGKFSGYIYDVYEERQDVSPERENRRGKTDAEKPISENPPILINDCTNKLNKLMADTLFTEWWDLYGKKVKKPDAEKAFVKALKKFPYETIVDGTKRFLEEAKRKGTDKKFIPYPATFLNAEQFNDEYETTTPEKPPYIPVDGERLSILKRMDEITYRLERTDDPDELKRLDNEWRELNQKLHG